MTAPRHGKILNSLARHETMAHIQGDVRKGDVIRFAHTGEQARVVDDLGHGVFELARGADATRIDSATPLSVVE